MSEDLISRQAAIDALGGNEPVGDPSEMDDDDVVKMLERIRIINIINKLPSAQPEQPPYVAEIDAEYQKAVKMPHIHKPLAKALYEVWKKHDREDTERRADGRD